MNRTFAANRLFEGLDRDLVEQLRIREFELPAGLTIFAEGDPGSTLLLVESGRVQITKLGRQGQPETLAVIGPHDFFGELAIIDHGPRSATAIALEPVRLGEIDAEGLEFLMRGAPHILPLTFTRAVVQRLRETNARFIEAMLQNERLTVVGTMVSSIVHDLRNPMAAILCSAAMLKEYQKDDSVSHLGGIIKSAAERMVSLSDELLDFARGTVRLKPAPTSVRRLLELLDEEILAGIRKSPIELIVRQESDADLFIDELRVLRCLLNIVKNAKEALGAKGRIEITVRESGPELEMIISDSGPGIPEECRGRIFEPFFTFGKKHGTGLGMAIAKATVDAHRGQIWLESVEGKGATFFVRIPKHCPAP
jgi:signal transduction histidine kinase